MEEEIISDDLGEETSRSLASMQVIKSLTPIEGADKIELCQFEGVGWKCVVEKGLRNVGDLVCYIETDSVLPELSIFEWMRPYKFRVKTIKLRGQISQGIVIGLMDVFKGIEEVSGNAFEVVMLTEGEDVTKVLGIKKYVPPTNNATGTQFGVMKTRGNFPSHIISKTDEIRVQAVPKILAEMDGISYVARVKSDGSSLTCGWDDLRNVPEFCVCSRNNMLTECEGNAFWDTVLQYDLREKLKNLRHLWVQGELVGGKIQGNKLGLTGFELHVFNIYDTRGNGRFLDDNGELEAAAKLLGLKLCEEVERKDHFGYTDIDQLVELAKGKYASGKQREGIVIRPQIERYSSVLKGRMSFKVINPFFLVENDE